jgi:hypothetical protein
VTAALDFDALHVELVAAPPPLRDQFRVGKHLPYPLTCRVENALNANLALA